MMMAFSTVKSNGEWQVASEPAKTPILLYGFSIRLLHNVEQALEELGHR